MTEMVGTSCESCKWGAWVGEVVCKYLKLATQAFSGLHKHGFLYFMGLFLTLTIMLFLSSSFYIYIMASQNHCCVVDERQIQ